MGLFHFSFVPESILWLKSCARLHTITRFPLYQFLCCFQHEKLTHCDKHSAVVPPWINLSKYWYDPHNESSEIGPENVVKLGIRIAEETYNEVDSTLEDFGRRMNDLEEMFIMYSTNYQGNFDFCLPLVKGLQTCPQLRHLDFCFTGDGSDYNQDLR